MACKFLFTFEPERLPRCHHVGDEEDRVDDTERDQELGEIP